MMREKYEEVSKGGDKGSEDLLGWALVTLVENTTCQKNRGWRGHSIRRAAFYCHRVTGEKAADLRKGVTEKKKITCHRGAIR